LEPTAAARWEEVERGGGGRHDDEWGWWQLSDDDERGDEEEDEGEGSRVRVLLARWLYQLLLLCLAIFVFNFNITDFCIIWWLVISYSAITSTFKVIEIISSPPYELIPMTKIFFLKPSYQNNMYYLSIIIYANDLQFPIFFNLLKVEH
jgi:hypothetical protein